MIGVTILNEIAINAVSLFCRREFKTFEYKETAINYLLSAESAPHAGRFPDVFPSQRCA